MYNLLKNPEILTSKVYNYYRLLFRIFDKHYENLYDHSNLYCI